VHALRHAHELLVPDGILIDLHPVTEEQVEAGGEIVGTIAEPAWIAEELPNAERRLEEAVREGRYTLEEELEFDLLQHFDEASELIDAKRDLLEAQPELLRRIRAAERQLVTRERYVGRRLRARRGETFG
jgi:hypothetical protein